MAEVITLGATYQDSITGLEGVATAYCGYLTGCNQVLIQPIGKKKKDYPTSHWIDEQRLSLVKNVPIVIIDNGDNPGFDKPAPKR